MLSGSVRTGQLPEYYERACRFRDQGVPGFRSDILFIYLTPGDVGRTEFESLEVQGGDKKAHVSWRVLLDHLVEFIPAPAVKPPILTAAMARLGADAVRDLISRDRRPVVEWTPTRLACQKLAIDVQALVEAAWAGDPLHFKPRWSDPLGDEVYATLNESKSGNVYFRVDSDSRLTEETECELSGLLQFRVTSRSRSALRGAFGSVLKSGSRDELVSLCSGGSELVIDYEKLVVEIRLRDAGQRQVLAANAARGFQTFLRIFNRCLQGDLANRA